MECPQTKFHVYILSNSILGQNFVAAVFFRYRYFIKVTTTDFDLFLQV